MDRFSELGGRLFLEGDGLGYQLPDTAEARELLTELRQNRDYVLRWMEAILPPLRSRFHLWMTVRCECRERWFTSISTLNGDFNNWLLEQDEALCSPSMFNRLLRDADCLCADGLVNGLTLQSDVRNLKAATYAAWTENL
jgi:hypothetical protein